MDRCAIVTDGLWRKSLAAVRSLGRRGYQVSVFGDSLFTAGFWSRYTARRRRSPSAQDDAPGFGRILLEYLKSGTFDSRPVLLPMEDATLMWLSEHRDTVAQFADFLIPSREALAVALNKSQTLERAGELDIPVPETTAPASCEEFLTRLEGLHKTGTNGTFLVKPVQGSGSAGVVYLADQRSIDWRAHWNSFGPLMIQRRLDPGGRGVGISVLMDAAGACVAVFTHERLQQYPNSGGPSTSRVGVVNDALEEMSVRLLKSLGWTGVAMVEWKQDLADGRPKLMEINPRFWGSLALAVRSGVDFPYLYARASSGERVSPVTEYRTGVECRWMIPGEILRYITQTRGEREGLRQFFRGLPGSAEEWEPDDLRGTFAVLICTLLSALNPKYWKYLRR